MSIRVDEKIVLDIQTTKAKVHIETERPKMTVKTYRAEMKVERQPPTFRRVKARRVGKVIRRTQMVRIDPALTKPFVKEAAKRIVADKNSKKLHQLENNISKLPLGADPINGINAYMGDDVQEETQVVWDPGYVKTTWTRPRMIIEWDIKRPRITVEPYSIKITPRRRGVVRASYRPKLQKQASKLIDKKV